MSANKLTEEQKDNLIIDCNNGMNRKIIAQKYNISETSVSYMYLHRKQLDCRKLTKYQIQDILNRFKAEEPVTILSKEYNVNDKFIYYLAKINNIERPSQKFQCEVNENFFQNITTEKQAYWLGFFMADGYVGDRYICLKLAYKDAYHLLQFRDDIGSTHALRILFNKDGHPNIGCTLTRKQMAIDLNTLGLSQNKTGNESFPEQLPEELYRHFIRGYFDGDGSVHIHHRGSNRNLSISFCCASLDFLLKIQDILIKECDLKKVKIMERKKINYYYHLTYTGNIQCTRIYKYLWEDANVYLPRKVLPILDSGLLKEEIKLGTYLDY